MDNRYYIEVFYSEDEGGYIAIIPALNNLAAFGKSKEEALKNINNIKKEYLKFLKVNGKPIPMSDMQ